LALPQSFEVTRAVDEAKDVDSVFAHGIEQAITADENFPHVGLLNSGTTRPRFEKCEREREASLASRANAAA
jgi:hypothetical protein